MEFYHQIFPQAFELSINISFPDPASPPPTPPVIDSPTSSAIDFIYKPVLRKAVIAVSGSIIAASIIFTFIYIIAKKLSRRRRSDGAESPPDNFSIEIGDEPHHIWYIKTAGLDQVTIEAISVISHKKGEGAVDGSDCAVCLGEFQDKEMLRLLPKCNHAFHVSCIDTWLQSHVNCPICRSMIVDPPQNSSTLNLNQSSGEIEDIEPLPPDESEARTAEDFGNSGEEIEDRVSEESKEERIGNCKE